MKERKDYLYKHEVDKQEKKRSDCQSNQRRKDIQGD